LIAGDFYQQELVFIYAQRKINGNYWKRLETKENQVELLMKTVINQDFFDL
jgi:hypothetical protein